MVPSIETCPVEYDVIKIKENEIYFGDFTAEQKEDIKNFASKNQNPSEGSSGICSTDKQAPSAD